MAAWVRGLVLVIFTYGLMAVMGLALAPAAALGPRGTARWAVRRYCGIVLAAARAICGLRTEVRGTVPTGEVVVAAKHQSFLDIIILARVLPAPRFVMKKSLVWAPVLGFYARRIGCVAIDRAARGRALRQMVRETAADREAASQLVIYPQGTRVPPGADMPYKAGAAALCEALGAPCVPAATNAGLFWPRKGIARFPGTAVVEFLAPIPPGLDSATLTGRLRREVEAASDRLMAEAGRGR